MTVTDTEQAAITLTDKAATEIKALFEQQGIENAALRVFVSGGGCSGLQYGLIFDEKRDGDLAVDFHGVGVVVDPESADYLRGAVVDYSDALTGGGFKVHNPNAHHSCGCGKSFEA